MTTEDWDFILEEVIETLPGKKTESFCTVVSSTF
jgi:hypothetical protein